MWQRLGRHARRDHARSDGGLGSTGHGAQHIALGHAAILARTGHRGNRQVVIRQQLGGSRHCDITLVAARRRGCWGRSHCNSKRRSSSRRRCGRCSTGLAFGIDLGDQLFSHYGGTVALNDFGQYTSGRCWYFQHYLVGFDFDQDFVHGHGITGLFLPGEHGGFSHGFRQLGDFDFYDSHFEFFQKGVLFWSVDARVAGLTWSGQNP
ncbi:hypothetical protein D3C71_1519590 [compost metagenome]